MKYITPFIIEIYIHDKIKIKLHYIYKRSSNIYIILRSHIFQAIDYYHHMSKTSSSKVEIPLN